MEPKEKQVISKCSKEVSILLSPSPKNTQMSIVNAKKIENLFL